MMKYLTISIFAALFLFHVLPDRLACQTSAGLDLVLLHASSDSVVIKAEMYTPQGVSFNMEAVYLAIAYDPTLLDVTASRGITNHYFASVGFQKDSNPLQDNDDIYPDISLYGESHPSFGSVPVPQNIRFRLCTFTFFPLSTNPGTTSFIIWANKPTGAMSGYYITTSVDNQPFSPALNLSNVYFPVELALFTAAQQGKSVVLKWITASETGNYGFYVERRDVSNTGDDSWKIIDFVKGAGDSKRELFYLFTDNTLPSAGSYQYRLKQQDLDGSISYSPIVIVEYRDTPAGFSLEQNYPNPVSSTGSSTVLRYSLTERSQVKLVATNILGQQVAELANHSHDAGNYTATWSPRGLPAGLYIATLTAVNEQTGQVQRASIRMNVLK